MPGTRPAILGLLLTCLACSGAHGTTDDDVGDDDDLACEDLDGDGRGIGAGCTGPDCDDGDPDVWEAEDCEARCDVDPHATGCPCDEAASPEPETCYGGDPGTRGVGPCRAGLRRCTGGSWSECDGQVVPTEEQCNDVDDDCDGEVDDGVRNSCGTCGPCERSCLGADEGCEDFDAEEEATGLVPCEGEPDCLTLSGTAESHHLLWIASARGGTISKIDTQERVEVGRYRTGPLGQSDGYLQGPGDGPSRTSVDRDGDVVVANRAFTHQSSVTRVAAFDCPDADRDGAVETSEGGEDLLAWGQDECVLWNTPVGANDAIARGLAVHDRVGLDGVIEPSVWVGLFDEHRYLKLDRADGSLTGEEADCAPCTPYGAAVDRDGNLWSACLSSNVCRFDTSDTDDVEVLVQPGTNYGITVDEDGLVWTCGSGCAYYDPAEREWTTYAWSAFGVAADGRGSMWLGSCYQDAGDLIGFGVGRVCRVDAETLDVTMVEAHSRGVAVDTDGFVWGVPMGGYLDVVDPGDGPGHEAVERVLDDCGGGACLVEPYTYSDMTGFQLRNATDPLGFYAHVFEGCEGRRATYWSGVTHDVTTPPGSSATLAVRAADDLDALAAAEWIVVGSTAEHASPVALDPFLGEGPHGRYLEVRVTLASEDRVARPLLRGLGVEWSCDGPMG